MRPFTQDDLRLAGGDESRAYDIANYRAMDTEAHRAMVDGYDGIRMDCFNRHEALRCADYARKRHSTVRWLFTWIAPEPGSMEAP